MIRKLLAMVLACAALISVAAHADQPDSDDAFFIRVDEGWKGYLPHGNEYVEYTASGDAQPQDASHVLLRPGMGMMLTFADKKDFGPHKNLLEAHRAWELDYWRKNADNVESKNRDDLAGGRRGLMVTEIDLRQADGRSMTIYMIAVAGKDGAFVFALSPATPDDDAMTKRLIASIKLVHKELDLKAEALKYLPKPAGKN